MRKWLFLISSLFSIGAHAGLTVSECVIREPVPGKEATALYLNIHFENTDQFESLCLPADEEVLGASIPALSDVVEVHMTEMVDGVMTMRRVPKIKIIEGKNELKPGGPHIMLKNLKIQPKVGDVYPVTIWMTYTDDLRCDAVVKTSAEIARAQESAL
ncbi:copper metallochaperone bacterial analog of Cox17 protein [Vibrio sp. RC586]|uniref:copper chaperone PCu(A)C n=1 Tax=Vibrio sp. RC586 TaxID=675815 RepID=UPI0001BB7DA3|nr:copper chaperone PCu(A)C [Vibrio sp. RC586]EEZ00464.1 copper metallochaperone bacterial analog of Cox17 protein [Vibrio sp. RC586]